MTPHICVCICTFKRPELLGRLLQSLVNQRTDGQFTYSAMVVDNDSSESARALVASMHDRLGYVVQYHPEPRQNIALARNAAVINSSGDYIATIDDDETASPEWLFRLYSTIRTFGVDGALGPVLPEYSAAAPRWLKKSGLCDRTSYPTGTLMTERHHSRTGNTLLDRKIFQDGKALFDPQYGLTGGEDKEFFDARISEGYRFAWCQEAPAYELVPPERCTFRFYLRKSARIAALTGEKMRLGTVPLWSNLVKSIVLAMGYTVALPFIALGGPAPLARHVTKYIYHVSRVLGTAGLVLIRER